MRIKPAWAITYVIKGFDAAESMTGWRWTGRVEADGFVLEEPPADADPMTLGLATVTSWQPYLNDALDDASRAVLDLCGIIGATYGGPSIEPVQPPSAVFELAGAKASRNVDIPDSLSFAMTQPLDEGLRWFAAFDLVQDDPELRADLDTLMVARREQDPAARFVHLYRIFDRHVRRVFEAEAPLLTDDQQAVATEALLGAASRFDLTANDLDRLKSSFANSILKVRMRSRVDILEAHFATAAFRDIEIDRSIVRRLDTVHVDNPGGLDVLRGEPELLTVLFAIVHRIVRIKLQVEPSRDLLAT